VLNFIPRQEADISSAFFTLAID